MECFRGSLAALQRSIPNVEDVGNGKMLYET